MLAPQEASIFLGNCTLGGAVGVFGGFRIAIGLGVPKASDLFRHGLFRKRAQGRRLLECRGWKRWYWQGW